MLYTINVFPFRLVAAGRNDNQKASPYIFQHSVHVKTCRSSILRWPQNLHHRIIKERDRLFRPFTCEENHCVSWAWTLSLPLKHTQPTLEEQLCFKSLPTLMTQIVKKRTTVCPFSNIQWQYLLNRLGKPNGRIKKQLHYSLSLLRLFHWAPENIPRKTLDLLN